MFEKEVLRKIGGH